jgi:hypothetical protein
MAQVVLVSTKTSVQTPKPPKEKKKSSKKSLFLGP